MEELAGEPQALFGLADVGFGFGELALSGGELLAKGFLLFSQDVEWNRLRIADVIGDELAALSEDALDFGSAAVRFALAIAGEQPEHLDQPGLQALDVLGVELDRPQVVLGDGALNLVDREVGELAAAAVVASAADEVVVLDPLLAGALREDQSALAQIAVDGALEVVAVLPLALASGVVRREHLLDLMEKFGRNQLRMGALVFDPAVADDADVVGVAQDAVQRGEAELACWARRRGQGAQAAFVEGVVEGAQRPVAGRVGLEGPAHVRGARAIEFDSANVVGALPAADVAIAKRC